jgi:acyl carrier protein
MTIERFIAALEENIEGLTPGSVRPETEFRTLPAWDSLASLSTLAVIDAEFGVQLAGASFRTCRTISDLFNAAAALAAK